MIGILGKLPEQTAEENADAAAGQTAETAEPDLESTLSGMLTEYDEAADTFMQGVSDLEESLSSGEITPEEAETQYKVLSVNFNAVKDLLSTNLEKLQSDIDANVEIDLSEYQNLTDDVIVAEPLPIE